VRDRVKEGADHWGLSMVREEGGARGGGDAAASSGEGGRKEKGARPGGPAQPTGPVRGQIANGQKKIEINFEFDFLF
jgi:hypothetical protein